MNAIRKKIDEYIMSILEKDEITPEEYAILVIEDDRRKSKSEQESTDTILRIFRAIN